MASILKRDPLLAIDRVEGHSDRCTDLVTSRRLPQTRMEGVISYLLQRGVRPEQIGARVNFGNTRPFRAVGTAHRECQDTDDNRVELVYNPPVEYLE